MNQECVVAGCAKPRRKHRTTGMCAMHASRLERHGSLGNPRPSTEDRLRSKFTQGHRDDCWEWRGPISSNGYGNFYRGGGRSAPSNVAAHRAVYELLIGEVPAGLVLDHLCRNRSCVNPSHLEPITQQENVRRGAAVRMWCAQGHPFSPENTRISTLGHRVCRECRRAIQQKNRQRRRQERAA